MQTAIATQAPMNSDVTVEILCESLDPQWGKAVPTKLLRYGHTDQIELSRQVGDNFDSDIEKARKILQARGLSVGPVTFRARTGVYMPVQAI